MAVSLLVKTQVMMAVLTVSYGLAINNGVVGVPKLECHEEIVSLDVETSRPFTGNIFVKGKAHDPACMRKFNKNTGAYAAYTMQLGRCGMQRLRSANPRGMSFVLTVIVSFHESFITKVDRAYHVRCFYMEPDEIVSHKMEVSMIPTTVLSRNMEMPTCYYSVRRDSPNGPLVNFANVGDRVFHVWECTGKDMGMMVKKCFVTDGQSKEQSVVDYEGCSSDEILLSELVYDATLMKAHAQSWVFKYADASQLFFTCQIRLCQKQMGLCQGVSPPKCRGAQKKAKRSINLMSLAVESNQMRESSVAATIEDDLPIIDVANEMTVVDLGIGVDSSVLQRDTSSVRERKSLWELDGEQWPRQAGSDHIVCLSEVGLGLLVMTTISLVVVASAVSILVYRRRHHTASAEKYLDSVIASPPKHVAF